MEAWEPHQREGRRDAAKPEISHGNTIPAGVVEGRSGCDINRPLPEDQPVHDWYRFVLSYPPHLVRHYLERFELSNKSQVLDPFCGTGTTLVECKKLGIRSIGVEVNPVVHFAATTKVDWSLDPDALLAHAERTARRAQRELSQHVIDDMPLFQQAAGEGRLRTLSPEQQKLLIADSISPRPLHKALILLEKIKEQSVPGLERHELLALARQAVYSFSNLRFGPEVGVGKPKQDAPVVESWIEAVRKMADDLRIVKARQSVRAIAHLGDARLAAQLLEPRSIDAVITSPPYPNEKDYSRTTRLESVLLGFITSMKELRQHKMRFLRSNTRNVYVGDDDDRCVADHLRISELASVIEARRLELGKTSGFEKLYARVVKLYFGGMARHLESLRPLLRPGAQLAYVVGDQASYFRVLIRTGEILAEVAERLGYEVLGIDLFRERFSTVTQDYLREEVVLLRWPRGP